MSRTTRAGQVALYLVLVCVPLLIAAAPPRPAGRSFCVELAVAIGFLALGQAALQFGLIARFDRVSRPFGIDLVMQLHRRMGALALLAMAVHGAILAALRPASFGARASPGVLAGIGSLALVAAIVVLTIARARIGLRYEAWRVSHAVLSVLALVLAQVHVSVSGMYAATPWKAVALAAFTGASLCVAAYLRLVRPALRLRRPYAVSEVRPEGGSTWTLALTPIGHPGLVFAPGQFAWITLGRSPWSVDEHPFSFSSSADQRGRIEFAIKELGDFTRTIPSAPVGATAWLDGPHGSFSTDFHESEAGYLFVAGGIGIAPVMSMLRTLADRSDRRPHVVVYACTRRERVSFWNELEALKKRLDLEVELVLDEPPRAGPADPAGSRRRSWARSSR